MKTACAAGLNCCRRHKPRVLAIALLALFLGAAERARAQAAPPAPPLSIATTSLPDAVYRFAYNFQLLAEGGTPPYRWSLVEGELPPGLDLDAATGFITGEAEALGQFRLRVQLTDSAHPAALATHEFSITVLPALSVQWKTAPNVTGDRIEGSVEVSSHVPDAVDLTIIVVAVNAIGKAFALGYQHVVIAPSTREIGFGSSLPRGGYVVHVDAVAEDLESGAIFRARLQTQRLDVP